jgi:hypothetical protein
MIARPASLTRASSSITLVSLMRAPKWSTRGLAFLQLLLVLPPLASGSICISADGIGRLESGFCACMAQPTGGSEAALGVTGTAECGPCQDHLFMALRNTVPPAGSALMPAPPLVTPGAAAAAAPTAVARCFWAGEPPGRRLPILRC